MTPEELKVTLVKLKHLMHGKNYEVWLGIDLFEDCKTLNDFYIQLKHTHRGTNPESIQPIEFSEADFWEEINLSLKFRGESVAGLKLSSKAEEVLIKEQAKYKTFIRQFISSKTKIYSYPDETGIPFYPVYWDYSFILLNEDRSSLFIFGSASD